MYTTNPLRTRPTLLAAALFVLVIVLSACQTSPPPPSPDPSAQPDRSDGLSGVWTGSARRLGIILELSDTGDGRLSGRAWYDAAGHKFYGGTLNGRVVATGGGGVSIVVTNSLIDGSGSVRFEGSAAAAYADRHRATEIYGHLKFYESDGSYLGSAPFTLER